MLILGSLIVIGLILNQKIQSDVIKSPFDPTPTPTRSFASYKNEGDTYFEIGMLDCVDPTRPDSCAIQAYKSAILVDPNNAQLQAELARIQAYSTKTLTTTAEKYQRMLEAQATIQAAAELEPENSYVHAVYAFVMDWLASVQGGTTVASEAQREDWLTEAENHALLALRYDETNVLALSYYAEILVDQQKWNQAEQTIQSAAEKEDPQNPIMDLHRVYGYVLENQARYEESIDEYKKALEINPNLTFLYFDIGNKYRYLGTRATTEEQVNVLMSQALEWFSTEAALNEQLGINDPLPYLAIANTYSNQGEHFSAVRNVRKALNLNPTSAEVFAQLGMVFRSARNYEGAIEAFSCALEGCDAEFSCKVRQCDSTTDQMIGIEQPLPLEDSTVHYYYIYGSILAALDKPSRPYCDQAVEVLSMVKEQYSSDPDIMGIVTAGEEICGVSASAAPTLPPEGTTTPEPDMDPEIQVYPTAP
jgi:tetratricopeptide (TPR) repeat protein